MIKLMLNLRDLFLRDSWKRILQILSDKLPPISDKIIDQHKKNI